MELGVKRLAPGDSTSIGGERVTNSGDSTIWVESTGNGKGKVYYSDPTGCIVPIIGLLLIVLMVGCAIH